MYAIVFPFTEADRIAVSIGPVDVRWYALAYIAGFILGWRYMVRLARRPGGLRPTPAEIDEFLTWAVLGTILGGRIGYILFYGLAGYLDRPLDALKIWTGGMSFHGGLAGVVLAMLLFARRRRIGFFQLADLVAAATPIGLLLGRIANFVNGELWGRRTDLAWGVVFPDDPLAVPRHPSQLYEALLEGLALFLVLFLLIRRPGVRARPGIVSGAFLALYGGARFLVEFARQPDAQLGFLWLGASMGQLLSIPMIVAGLAILAWALRRPKLAPAAG